MERVSVYFLNSMNIMDEDETKRTYHGTYNSMEEAEQSVYDWWEANDFKCDRLRILGDIKDGIVRWDYGNHNGFYLFVLEGAKVEYTIREGVTPPKRGRENDVAHDLFTADSGVLVPGRLGSNVISTGIKTAFNPKEYGLFINPRGGMMKYPITLGNTQGVVEGEYRGEVGLPLKNTFPIQLSYRAISKNLLVINEEGKLVGVPVDDVREAYPEFDKLYEEQLNKLSEELGLIYGEADIYVDEQTVIAGTLFIPKGTRLCQAFLLPRYDTQFIEVDKLSDTERGTGAYGSSGVK
nr:MAG TPA: deoxyuridine 5'-triphosphate nucleotidohydrolase [Herelleviridae sp.]